MRLFVTQMGKKNIYNTPANFFLPYLTTLLLKSQNEICVLLQNSALVRRTTVQKYSVQYTEVNLKSFSYNKRGWQILYFSIYLVYCKKNFHQKHLEDQRLDEVHQPKPNLASCVVGDYPSGADLHTDF